MPDTNILAGMTPAQADADIAAREAAIERLEATLKGAKENLKAARAERKHLEEPAVSGDGERVEAQAGVAEASGEANA